MYSSHQSYIVFGEGPALVQAGYHRGTQELKANDFRFTTKGEVVFVFICGEPEGKVKIKEFNKLKYHNLSERLDSPFLGALYDAEREMLLSYPEILATRAGDHRLKLEGFERGRV